MKDISRTHDISVLTYNLRFHLAYEEAFELAHENDVDVICLQECYPSQLERTVGDFTLASKTSGGFLGLAIYYRTGRFELRDSSNHRLKASFYERYYKQEWERLLVAKLYDSRYKKIVVIASFHATHLIASNRLRRDQMTEAFAYLKQLHLRTEQLPVIMTGDYNYPWFHKKLGAFVMAHGYSLHVTDKHTLKNSFFRGKFDLASARNISSLELEVLSPGKSDHMAVYIKAKY